MWPVLLDFLGRPGSPRPENTPRVISSALAVNLGPNPISEKIPSDKLIVQTSDSVGSTPRPPGGVKDNLRDILIGTGQRSAERKRIEIP